MKGWKRDSIYMSAREIIEIPYSQETVCLNK